MTASDTHMAARIGLVGESKTAHVFELARKLQAQGREIISLAVGEPEFDTPGPVVEATQQALADQVTRYGPVPGEEALRSRLAQNFKGFTAENIIVTNGAKQALYSLFQVLCDPGDEIIIPRPCWVSFTEQVKLAGGKPVLVDTAEHQLDPDAIEEAITPRTRAILVNSPNNPTGAVYAADALSAVAQMAADRKLYLISDEAYHCFTYDQRPHVAIAEVAPDRQQVITVRSFSKHYSMTGFRIGYVAAPAAVITALARLQSHSTGNVCSFGQYGALAALQMDQAIIEERRAILQRRRDMAYERASTMFNCVKAQGAFYLFPEVFHYLRRNETSEDLAMLLLDKAGVAVVPGDAFHEPGHVRISFAVPGRTLARAFKKIKAVL